MTFSLRLTHQIALVVILPLLIELGFLYSLMGTLSDIQEERQSETVAIKTLASVNLVLNDVLKCGNLLLFDPSKPGQDVNVSMNYVGMQTDLHDLKVLIKDERLQSPKLRAFTDAVDRLIDSCDQEFDIGPAEFALAGKNQGTLEKEVRTIIETGGLVTRELSKTRMRKTELRNLHEAQLQQTVLNGSIATLTIALILTLYLLMRFGNGLGTLLANTANLAIGKPLLPRVKGNDELSKLDELIHSLSDELNRTRERERALIDNTAMILCSLDESFHIVEINQSVRKILGYEIEDMVGSVLSAYVHEADRSLFAARLGTARSGSTVEAFEVHFLARDGEKVDCETTTQWSSDNHEYFLSIQNVSERKESERLKAQVMELISLDLRAPLSAIARDLEVVREGRCGALNDRGNRLTRTASQSVSSLMALVGDLLDIERLESDATLSLAYDRVSCAALLERAVDMVRAAADKKNLNLSVEADEVEIEVDPDRLVRVLVNLLGNALKFTPEGKAIDCSARLVDTEGGINQIEFRIADQGPGIAEEKLETIFEKFRQADLGVAEEKAGSGLGLAICRAIVEAHHGAIGVESIVCQGSEFWFRLPLAPRPGRSNVSANKEAVTEQ